MIERIAIKNFKSIEALDFHLGRVNVLIGANGSGKSNVLEAIGMVAAKKGRRVDLEDMAQRGIRIAMPELMVNSFYGRSASKSISVKIAESHHSARYIMRELSDEDIYTPWSIECIDTFETATQLDSFEELFSKYVIYSPSIDALRGLSSTSKIYPIGLHGEGLDVLMFHMSRDEMEEVSRIASRYISWLDDLVYDTEGEMKYRGYKLGRSNSNLYFNDRFMQKRNRFFSAENANEGALLVLFYLVLMISKATPRFFAIDNIDSGLNPRLCRALMKELPRLAALYGKQVIFTTHNPAMLDGLRLGEEDTRLFAVERSDSGSTIMNEIRVKPTSERRMKLSEMWMSGMIGGVPNEF
jgi:AAA15 family ATPase/GTPase